MNNRIFTIIPSWLIKSRKELLDGCRTLEQLGFGIYNKPFLKIIPSPWNKARQLHSAVKDKHTGIVMAQRGGYSSMKMLPYINFKLIRKYPKKYCGFSDFSTLLNSIYEKTGIITYHSPMVFNFSNPAAFTKKSFVNAMSGFPQKNLFYNAPVTVYRHGIAEGVLKGGNLITLTALINTCWEINTDNCIIFLEDVDEKIHEVDRYLTQWVLTGKFKKVKGLVLGDFRDIDNKKVYNILKEQLDLK